MKVGMITFHNGSNYGAALQTYALQEVLKELYSEVYVINYKNPFIMQGLKKIRLGFSLYNIYFSIIDLINYKKNKIKIKRFHDFFRNYYTMTRLMDKKQLLTTVLKYDLYVSGSDQIWNPLLNNILDETYFCRFPETKRLIAYASSIGNYKFLNAEWNSQINEYLRDYDRISVRENAELIYEHTGILPKTMIDPTLLLSKEKWKDKLNLLERSKSYILVYAMGNIQTLLSYAKRVAQQKNYKIIFIGSTLNRDKNITYIKDAGPVEFVDLFYNAAYIVTNSFHGTAFAVNFEKQFASIYNEKSPQRAETFLNNVGLEKYLIKDIEMPIQEITVEEFENAQVYLKAQRNHAKDFLNVV